MSIFLAIAFSVAAQPQLAADPHEAALRAALESKNTGDELQVDVYGDGSPALVLGRFDVGVSAASGTALDVARAISKFVADNGDVYGPGPHADIVVTDVLPADEFTFTAFLDQRSTQGRRIWHSDLVGIFNNDGSIQGGCDPDHGAMLTSARWNAA